MKPSWLAIGILTCSALLFAQPGMPAQGPYPSAPPAPQGSPDAGAPADEPGRAVARLGILNGDASIKRGDSNDWQAAAINAPLMSGDQISVAAGARAEIEIDSSHFLRIGSDTELRLADLENGHYQVQVAHGTITWRVLRDSQAQADISTPLVDVHPGALSTVRIEVSPDGTSHITVRKGEAEVSTQKGSEKLSENSTMDIRGSMNDPEFQVVAAAPRDEFDGWSDQRDTYLLRAQSQRYVTKDVQGVEDLDAYGHWVWDPAYGWVWSPTVASNWAPYQNGQWVWEDYYGWTWVDYAPWGWAPFHYGYWYSRGALGWAWYPGPRIGHVWWRPAMVGFFGWGGGIGVSVGFGFGNVGWIPLAPHEVFHPWYGRGGFVGVNAAVVRNVNIVGTYRNAGVVGGVTAVSAVDFQRGNFRNTVAVDRNTLAQASLVRGAVPMTPTSQNLRFSNRTTSVTPVAGAGAASRFYNNSSASRPTVQRTPFAQQQAAVRSAVSAAPSASSNSWRQFETPQSRPGPSASQPSPGSYNRYNNAPNPGMNSAPRQVQVAPSIVRPAAPSAPQSYGGGNSAPAPRGNGGGGAPGGGGGSHGGGNSHSSGGRR